MTTRTTLAAPKIGQVRDEFLRSDAGRKLAPDDLSRLRKFVTWCGVSTSIEAVPPFKIEEFLGQQMKTSQPPRQYMAALRAFFKYAHEQRAVEADPMKAVRLPRGAGGSSRKSAATAPPAPAPARKETSIDSDVVYVSRAHHETMQAELERLRTDERHRISQILHEAIKDGDLSENAAYDDAKMQQGLLEARIRDLEAKLRNVELIEDQESGAGSGVNVGSRVKLVEVASGDTIEYQVVGPEETNPRDGKISHRSPVGQAIMGKGAGEVVEVATPGGSVRYRIEDVE
ncbi:MAG: transcription elongation factor GreA [Chloroflexota bacterium]